MLYIVCNLVSPFLSSISNLTTIFLCTFGLQRCPFFPWELDPGSENLLFSAATHVLYLSKFLWNITTVNTIHNFLKNIPTFGKCSSSPPSENFHLQTCSLQSLKEKELRRKVTTLQTVSLQLPSQSPVSRIRFFLPNHSSCSKCSSP